VYGARFRPVSRRRRAAPPALLVLVLAAAAPAALAQSAGDEQYVDPFPQRPQAPQSQPGTDGSQRSGSGAPGSSGAGAGSPQAQPSQAAPGEALAEGSQAPVLPRTGSFQLPTALAGVALIVLGLLLSFAAGGRVAAPRGALARRGSRAAG
jgi:hypothetical protein